MLQIRLITLGMRHPDTINALENLGNSLDSLERHGEAQLLLETSLHFRLETVKNSGNSWGNERAILWDVAVLAQVLRHGGRYDENENVLDFAYNLLGCATRWRDWESFEYHYERARTHRLQKRFENSEKIL